MPIILNNTKSQNEYKKQKKIKIVNKYEGHCSELNLKIRITTLGRIM